MGDLNIIDRFMATFIQYIDSGFGLLRGDVAFLTTTLVGIDITLAGLFWALGGENDVIGRFLKKILYVMKPASSRSRGAAPSPRSSSTGFAIRPFQNRSAASYTRARAAAPASSLSFATERFTGVLPRTRGAKPNRSPGRRCQAMSRPRSAKQLTITPIMWRLGGRPCWRKLPRSDNTFSIAGRGSGANPLHSPVTTSASRWTHWRCVRRHRLPARSLKMWRWPRRRSTRAHRFRAHRMMSEGCSTRRKAGL